VTAKRLFDVAASLLGLLLLAPFLLLAALLVRLDSPGPALFRQERVGRNGRPFRILKFRTMCVDAESKGMSITVGADRRITRAGAFLRRYKLDELPQLLNVLRGEMSLVGPRPEVPRYVAMYPAEVRERVLSLPPGITDPASIVFRDEGEILAAASDPEAAYVREVMPAKLSHYLRYVEGRTFTGDLRIILDTLRAIAH
jgi:lipopolysaccharide/colanic/teichoic acid biosynthesis glycosyltransferase